MPSITWTTAFIVVWTIWSTLVPSPQFTSTAFGLVALPVTTTSRQSQWQRPKTVVRRPNVVVLGSTTQSRDVDDWEAAEYEAAPPTDLEKFLSTRFPEFWFLLQQNEAVLAVVRADVAQRPDGITLFAPNAQAFSALGPKRLSQLEDERNLETAAKMAAFHVIDTQAVTNVQLFTEDWTKGRPRDGQKPDLTIEGISTLGGTVPVGRSAQDTGLFGTGWFAQKGGDATVVGTNNARVVQSFTSTKGKWIVHEMTDLISPELLWRYCDQLRIPGF